MFDRNSLFFQRSKSIAEQFLQTTVIVDDQAYFGDKREDKEEPSPVQIESIITPGRESEHPQDDEPETTPTLVQLTSSDDQYSHRLNAQKVINSFAQKHIVCSVIKPDFKNDKDLITSVENLTSCADIIIIDWELNGDDGEKALNIMEQILKSTIETPAQLRLFAIYTGDPGISDIALEIKKTLEERLGVGIDTQDDGFSLTFASTRIVVFAKPDTSNLPPEYEHRKVSFEDLADRVISEFAVMTAGLVSNVVIKSLTLIRKNTRKILNKFSVHLDAPYLTHRALQMNTEDAEELLTALVAEELRAILEEGNVGEEANLDSIKEWLLSIHAQTLTLAFQEPKNFNQEKVIELLKHGIDKWDGAKKSKAYTLLTKMFKPQSLIDEFLDEKFALITTLRSSYEKRMPKLMFGTILRDVKSNHYWVCIQPRCDCIRITTDRVFPFLPLKISENNKKFNIVLEKEAQYIKLALNNTPHDLKLITFVPLIRDKGMIKAKAEETFYYFTDKSKKKYKWIGELRPEHAQRIANEFASNLSRVGLDESEWLRLWATKG